MSAQRDFDLLLRSWLDESAPSRQPEGLLEAVLETTGRSRPRPAWLVRLSGEPMLEPGRSGLNRIAPLALGATVLVVTLLIGISLLVRPPDVGPPAPPRPPDPSAPAASVGDSPFVRGSHWVIVSFDATAIPEPGSDVGWYLHFHEGADTVLFDPGCAELDLAVSHDPRGSAIGFGTYGAAPLCGTVEYVQLVRQMVGALAGVEHWQPAGEAFDLVGTSTIRVRLASCTAGSPHPGDVDVDCSPELVSLTEERGPCTLDRVTERIVHSDVPAPDDRIQLEPPYVVTLKRSVDFPSSTIIILHGDGWHSPGDVDLPDWPTATITAPNGETSVIEIHSRGTGIVREEHMVDAPGLWTFAVLWELIGCLQTVSVQVLPPQ